jgi:general secretion pathway protein A
LRGEQLLGYVTDELTGETGGNDEPPRASLRRLDQFLASNVEAGQHAVLLVDEAHLLTAADQLETLRLLLNVQREQAAAEAAWTLVLVGHATLFSVIERNRALDERMSVKCVLTRLQREETTAYLQHRLQVVGGVLEEVMTPAAIEAIHLRSGGNPRRINRLADLGLMVGYAEDLQRIDAAQIDGVYQELLTAAA